MRDYERGLRALPLSAETHPAQVDLADAGKKVPRRASIWSGTAFLVTEERQLIDLMLSAQ